MKKRIIGLFSRHMAAIVIATSVFAYFVHGSFTSWIGNPDFVRGFVSVPHLLMLVRFGMGLTLTPGDFLQVFRQPRGIIAGEAAQFLFMPALGFLIAKLLDLPPDLAVGVILVGCCPGGTASNVMTYMAKGDVALSIGMTAVSTLLAPVVTPLATMFYIGLYQHSAGSVETDAAAMFTGIAQIVIVPVLLGLLVNTFFSRLTGAIKEYLPVISCVAICLIIGVVIDGNSSRLAETGWLLLFAVALHNVAGCALGFFSARLLKLSPARQSAITLEVGMQNSGLATHLAMTCFPALALAAAPGAIFSVWHNISGAIVAALLRRMNEKQSAARQATEPEDSDR